MRIPFTLCRVPRRRRAEYELTNPVFPCQFPTVENTAVSFKVEHFGFPFLGPQSTPCASRSSVCVTVITFPFCWQPLVCSVRPGINVFGNDRSTGVGTHSPRADPGVRPLATFLAMRYSNFGLRLGVSDFG